MKIVISGSQIELTEAMKAYVEKKLAKLEKLSDKISEAKVILGLETHHRQKGDIFFMECKLMVPGKDLFAKSMNKDLYAAIDLVRDELEQELKKYKQKIRGNLKKHQNEMRATKEYQNDEE